MIPMFMEICIIPPETLPFRVPAHIIALDTKGNLWIKSAESIHDANVPWTKVPVTVQEPKEEPKEQTIQAMSIRELGEMILKEAKHDD